MKEGGQHCAQCQHAGRWAALATRQVSNAAARLVQVMSSQAGGAPSNGGAANLGGIEAAAATVATLQTASSSTLNSMPQSAFERAGSGAPGGGSFAALPGFAGLATGQGSRAASLGGSPCMPNLQAAPPPPPHPPSPAALSPAITPRPSIASPPDGGTASLAQVRFGVSDTNALLASMKVRRALADRLFGTKRCG